MEILCPVLFGHRNLKNLKKLLKKPKNVKKFSESLGISSPEVTPISSSELNYLKRLQDFFADRTDGFTTCYIVIS